MKDIKKPLRNLDIKKLINEDIYKLITALEYKHMNKKVSKEKVVIYDTSKFGAFKI
jgi:hypothetical protein